METTALDNFDKQVKLIHFHGPNDTEIHMNKNNRKSFKKKKKKCSRIKQSPSSSSRDIQNDLKHMVELLCRN